MGAAARYWRLIRLDGTGQRRMEEVAFAKQFFAEQFPNLAGQRDIADLPVQRHLIQVIQKDANHPSTGDRAECCLRCYVSHQIEQACLYLETQFGSNHGFTRYDLFPLVLDDDGKPKLRSQQPGQYRTLATEILQTFDPERASLGTWTSRLVRQHEELTCFLREHGVFLISDWALLNNTQPRQLQRILTEFHTLTPVEVNQACDLLQAYHEVYRSDRLQQRQTGVLKSKAACQPPTPEQLTRMAMSYQAKTNGALSSDRLLSKLQKLAGQLRQYRLHQQGGNTLVTDSLDRPETQARAVDLPIPETDVDQEAQQEFLQVYRQQFLVYLDQAIEQATGDRVAYLKRKSAQTAEHFLRALHLFHCQGKSMGEIATHVGLEAQFQVTRLMKLKEFRASIRQHLMTLLIQKVLEIAQLYTHTSQIQSLDQQIEAALDEQISTLMQQAEAEAAVAKQQPLTSLFSRRLCQFLDTQCFVS